MSETYSQPPDTMGTAEKVALAGIATVVALAAVGAVKVAKLGFDAYVSLLREEDAAAAEMTSYDGGPHHA